MNTLNTGKSRYKVFGFETAKPNSGSLQELNKINGLQTCKSDFLRQLSNIGGLINCTLQQISYIKGLEQTPNLALGLDYSHGNWHDDYVAAKSADSFDRLNTRRVSRPSLTVFLRPKSTIAPLYGVVVGEAERLAGIVCRSVNPCHHATLWNDSHSVDKAIHEVQL